MDNLAQEEKKEQEKNFKFLYGHVSPETAYIVENYPWGFRLRTTIRYWIETKQNFGQRFASQTINPKNGKWCKPKYSTYNEIIVLFLNNDNHLKWYGLRLDDGIEYVEKFKERHLHSLDDFQKSQLKKIIAFNKIMNEVEITVKPCPIGPVSLFSSDPLEVEKRKLLIEYQENRKKEQEQELKKINRAINHEITKINF